MDYLEGELHRKRPGPDTIDTESDIPPAVSRAHANFHAREDPWGIGAAVVRSTFDGTEHIWECIVSNGDEWRYIRVLGRELGPFPNLSTEDVEQGVERFAASLPAPDRIRQLLGVNPLHIDRDGNVTD